MTRDLPNDTPRRRRTYEMFFFSDSGTSKYADSVTA